MEGMKGGLVRLRALMDDLTPSERKIGAYILDHPQETVQSSVAQLSERSGGSPAAIIRLCKSLGVSGFQELKLKIAGDLQTGEQYHYTEIRPQDSMESIIQHVSANNIQSVKDTVHILDPRLVEQAVDALHRAKRIFFYGVGASNLIALDAHYKFMRINRTSFSFADPHMQISSSTTLREDDAVVCISYSGETSNVISCLKHALDGGAATISITKWGSNTLSSLANVPLKITSTESDIRSGATSSRIAQLNVIDILYLAIASRDYNQSIEYLEKSRQAILEHK